MIEYHPDLAARIEQNSMPEPNSGCHLWLLGVDKNGYGKLKWRGKTIRAHRVSHACFNAPVPDAALVCHRCDTPGCVNPDHLRLGDWKDNMEDKVRRGRVAVPVGNARSDGKLSEAAVADIRTKRLSQSAFAKLYGVSQGTLSRAQRGSTWKVVPVAADPNISHRVKLSRDAVEDILTMRMSQIAFSRLYGVSFSLISQVQRGQIWPEITGGINRRERKPADLFEGSL